MRRAAVVRSGRAFARRLLFVRHHITFHGRPLIAGHGAGGLLHSDTALSFWGGVDPVSGIVIDHQHPLRGQQLSGRVLVLPSGRGSSTSSQVILALILGGKAPAAILLRDTDPILALGAIVAEEMFGQSLPIVVVGSDAFAELARHPYAEVDPDGRVRVAAAATAPPSRLDHVTEDASVDASTDASMDGSTDASTGAPGYGPMPVPASPPPAPPALSAPPALDAEEAAMLRGDRGPAAQAAMRIVVRAAQTQGAARLVPVTQAHIDGCMLISPASLRFALRLVELGGRVSVPTTLNALSVDTRRWRQLRVPPEVGVPASALGDAYVRLGAQATFTCAPYLLDSAPGAGEHVGWGESNAVVFANSVLGARTQKYADFLDACIALTGRAPAAGAHLSSERRPTLTLRLCPWALPPPDTRAAVDDAFWPLLGYVCGRLAGGRVPLILGLEGVRASTKDLQAFCAAFGTTAAAPLFHMCGHTPAADGEPKAAAAGSILASELDGSILASELGGSVLASEPGGSILASEPGGSILASEPGEVHLIDLLQLREAFDALDGGGHRPTDEAGSETEPVQLIALGNPHASLGELSALAALTRGRERHRSVRMIVMVGRHVLYLASAEGYVRELERFGATLLSDTCWCMLGEPVVPPTAVTIVTNSAKYAHYAPGLTGRRARFTSLAGCVQAAVDGSVGPSARPGWLASRARTEK